MDVFVGIEGANISDDKCIAIEDITKDNKLKLTLNVKAPQDASPMLPKQFSAGPEGQVMQQYQKPQEYVHQVKVAPEESQTNIAVSLPMMTTESQFDNAIKGVTESIKRVRNTKEEMNKKLNVSEFSEKYLSLIYLIYRHQKM